MILRTGGGASCIAKKSVFMATLEASPPNRQKNYGICVIFYKNSDIIT